VYVSITQNTSTCTSTARNNIKSSEVLPMIITHIYRNHIKCKIQARKLEVLKTLVYLGSKYQYQVQDRSLFSMHKVSI